jgi:hypothetical protein
VGTTETNKHQVIMKQHAAILLLAFLLLPGIGCSPPPSPRRFNNTIVGWNAKLASSSEEFVQTLNANPPDPDATHSAYTKMESTLKDVRADYEDFTWPSGSSSGEDFYNKYKDFLDTQDRILGIYQKIALRALTNPRDPQIRTFLGQASSAESKALKALKDAQDALKNEHNLEMDGGY